MNLAKRAIEVFRAELEDEGADSEDALKVAVRAVISDPRVSEAIAAAYGDRHPESTGWQRQEMARAAVGRIEREFGA